MSRGYVRKKVHESQREEGLWFELFLMEHREQGALLNFGR